MTIRPAESVEELRTFYDIFKEFSVAKGFMSRGLAYQESLWKEFVSRGNGRLFLAVYEDRIIGGLICLMFGKKCLAMHMGTPYVYQKLQSLLRLRLGEHQVGQGKRLPLVQLPGSQAPPPPRSASRRNSGRSWSGWRDTTTFPFVRSPIVSSTRRSSIFFPGYGAA